MRTDVLTVVPAASQTPSAGVPAGDRTGSVDVAGAPDGAGADRGDVPECVAATA